MTTQPSNKDNTNHHTSLPILCDEVRTSKKDNPVSKSGRFKKKVPGKLLKLFKTKKKKSGSKNRPKVYQGSDKGNHDNLENFPSSDSSLDWLEIQPKEWDDQIENFN